MSNREKNCEELRQEIEILEAQLEEKKGLCKPVMVPSSAGSVIRLGTYELRKEIEEIEREIQKKQNLLSLFESDISDEYKNIPRFDKESLLLPEYRQGGYFTSQDFYDKCEEFHRLLEKEGETFKSLPRNEYIFRKKKFLREKYGIEWLAEEYQFLPGVVVDVHISHPKN